MKHYHFSSVSSTNDYARELVKTDPEVVVSADYQWGGRGRNERVWEGMFGLNIYCSAALMHPTLIAIEQVVLYQAAGCLAAKSALVKLTGNNDIFHLKYPNDVLALCPDGRFRKICGVLVEHGFMGNKCEHSIIGIGINVRQDDFSDQTRPVATSLLLLGYDLTTADVLPALIDEIDIFVHKPYPELYTLWKKELSIEGRLINIIGDQGLWKVERLLEDGRLEVINTQSKARRLVDDGDSIRYTDFNIAKP